MGHRCRNGSHDETRIQVLRHRLPTERDNFHKIVSTSPTAYWVGHFSFLSQLPYRTSAVGKCRIQTQATHPAQNTPYRAAVRNCPPSTAKHTVFSVKKTHRIHSGHAEMKMQEPAPSCKDTKKVRPFDLTLKRRLPTLPRANRSTIGVSELNFSVRNGKRWNLTAITT